MRLARSCVPAFYSMQWDKQRNRKIDVISDMRHAGALIVTRHKCRGSSVAVGMEGNWDGVADAT